MLKQIIMVVVMTGALAVQAGTRSMPGEPPPVEPVRPEVLSRAGFDQKLNAQIPLDLDFRDETGRTVKLGDYFGQKPVLINLAYFNCPMLCTLVINGVVDAVRDVSFVPGQDFEILTISFDAREGHELAAAKKANYLKDLGRPGAEQGWHFLTGDEASIKALTEAVGFVLPGMKKRRSSPMPAASWWPRRPVAYLTISMACCIRRAMCGLALVEASSGRIGNPVDQLMLFCFHYDPVAGKFSAGVMTLVRAGCLATMGAMAIFLVVMFRREASYRRAMKQEPRAVPAA
jgi:protein SCO1/2